MRKNGNVVLIAPREELALKEKQQLEAANEISELEPLVSESFQLNYIKASDILNIITSNRQQQFGLGAGQTATTGGQGSIISKRGVAFVDPRSNILFVQDTASRLEEVRKIIRQIDTPIRQVLIEARIVIANDVFSKQLGVRFGAVTGFKINNRYAVGQQGSLSTQPSSRRRAHAPHLAARHADADPLRACIGDAPCELLGFAGAQRQPAGDEPRRPARVDAHQPRQRQPDQSRALGARIRQPRQGRVESARGHRRQPEGADRAGHGNSLRDAGQREQPGDRAVQEGVLRLDVTPQITPDNRIIMNVEIRKDSVGQLVNLGGGFQVPSIDTRNVTTQIAVNNGDTAVIGGIYERRSPIPSTRCRCSATYRSSATSSRRRRAEARSTSS
jgi:type IV pilus assembly protein PilQ